MVYVYVETEQGAGGCGVDVHTVCIGQAELDPDPVEVFTTTDETAANARAQFVANKLRLCGVEVQLH